jgi:hypothetical protein
MYNEPEPRFRAFKVMKNDSDLWHVCRWLKPDEYDSYCAKNPTEIIKDKDGEVWHIEYRNLDTMAATENLKEMCGY